MFKVGDVVVLTDGKRGVMRRIDGVKGGNLSIGHLRFDWCGNEIDMPEGLKIRPLQDDENTPNK